MCKFMCKFFGLISGCSNKAEVARVCDSSQFDPKQTSLSWQITIFVARPSVDESSI